MEILNHDQKSINTIDESHNNYGDFLFVTISRAAVQAVTMPQEEPNWLTAEDSKRPKAQAVWGSTTASSAR